MYIKRILAIGFIFIFMLTGTTFAQEGYSEIFESTGSIFSLPENSVKGQLNVSAYGNTVINLPSDAIAGCESTAGWTVNGATISLDSSNQISGSYCLKGTLTTSVGYIRSPNLLSYLTTDKYYLLSAYIKNGNASGLGVRLRALMLNDIGYINDDWTTGTSWTRSGIVIQPTDFDGATGVYLDLVLDGANTEYGYIDEIMVNEISASEYAEGVDVLMDKYNYVKPGVNSTLSFRAKTRNINIFDGEFESGFYNSSGAVSSTTYIRSKNYIRVEPSTIYNSNGAKTDDQVLFYDINKNYISMTGSFPFTTPSNCTYIRFYFFGTDLSTEYAISKGSTQATYVNHEFSEAYVNVPFNDGQLTRVPNSSADEVDFNIGTATQRNNKIILNGSEAWVSYGSNDDNVYAGIANWQSDNNSVRFWQSNLGSAIAYNIDNNNFSLDGTLLISYSIFINSSGALFLVLPKTTGITDLTSFEAYLASKSVSLIYQLATPKPEEISIPPLIAYENGTVIIEPVVQDSAIYNESNGLVISNPSLPGEEVESIKRIYVDSGNVVHRQDLDPSSAISSIDNGTKIILNDAQAGETYQFTYRYPQELTTIPTIEYSVPINQTGQINGNTNMIQQNRSILDTIIQDIDGLWNQLQKE